MVETGQYFSLQAAIPLKKRHVFAKKGRDQEQRNIAVFYLFQVVVPELVFHKNDQFGVGDFEEAPGVAWTIHWQVKDPIGAVIIFPHFIAGRRKKGQQNAVGRVLDAELLYHRPPLLKFAQRGTVHPDNFGIGRDGCFQFFKDIPPALQPFFCFFIKRRRQVNPGLEKQQKDIVEKYAQAIDYKEGTNVKAIGETTCILLFLPAEKT